MMLKGRIPGRLALISSLALVLMPALYAQEGTTPERGSIEIGIRALAGDRSSSQFNEYRDIRPGLFVSQASLDLEHLFHSNYFFNFQTVQSWQNDQHFLGVFGNYGKFNCEVRRDGTPHDFTNTAATLFTESSPGVFTVPAAVRTNLVANAASLPVMVAGATRLEVGLQRRLTGGTCQFTPSAAWTFFAQYNHDAESGHRPLGTTLNDETHVLEQMEPVDYTTHEVNAGLEYAAGKIAFQAGYGASIFTDARKALYWDNPFLATDAIGAGAHGQMALYPDNTVQNFNFAGAWNLSKNTRLMASVSPGWMRQNTPFLPFTVNSAVVNVPALPAASLNGRKTTIAANITLTSHPLPQLSLTARYRDYDYINNTPSLFFSDYVYTDRQLDNLARQSLPFGFNRQSVETTASWRLHKGESITAGYEFVSMDREHRDVAKSRENIGSITFDANPKQWFSLRTSYQHSDRNPQSYVLNQELYPKGGMPAVPDGWMMFDEAARVRNHASGLVQVDASDRFSFSASYDNTQDRYNDSLYGLLGYRSLAAGTDFAYRLRNGISLFGNYAYERYKSDQRARQYSKTNMSSNNDWESYIGDAINTFAAGISLPRFHRNFTIDAFYSLSFAKDRINNRALGNPLLPGFLVTTAQDYPETGNRFHQLTGAVRYRLANNLYSKLEYRWERYDRNDFQIQYMTPNMVQYDSKMATSLFLGADVPSYQVHIVSVSLNYVF
jgi:MtrB/PioB family decaheme-associated outer membrane protein